jgi:hypothetical protein
MSVHKAIKRANKVLPGVPAPDREPDIRWDRIIDVSVYVDSDPEPVWAFIERWGSHENEDLRMAIGLCLLEHLLGYHFDLIFPRVERRAAQDPLFAYTFRTCRKMGQAETPENEARWGALLKRLSGPPAA